MISESISVVFMFGDRTSGRGLGRIWETGCVKKINGCVKFWLAMLEINSFSFLPHLQPKKQLVSPFLKNWVTFLAQLFKKT